MIKLKKSILILKKIKFNFKSNIAYFLFLSLLSAAFEILGIGLIYPLVKIILLTDVSVFIENYRLDKYFPFITIHTEKYILLRYLCFFIFIIFFIKFLIKILLNYKMGKVYQLIKTYLSSYLVAHYLKLDLKNFLLDDQANKVRNILGESDSFSKNYINSICLITEILLSISILIIIFFINQFLILFIGSIMLLIFFGHRFFLKKKVEKISEKRIFLDGQNLKKLTEIFNNYKELKFFLNTERFLDRIINDIENLNIQKFKLDFISSSLRPIIELISIAIIISMFLIISFTIKINSQEFIAQFSVIIFSFVRIIPSVNRITSLLQTSFSISKSVDLIFNELNITPNYAESSKENYIEISKKQINFTKSIVANELSYEYSDKKKIHFGNKLQFHNHSLNVITGRSGLGKTTLLDILSGLRKPKGKIVVDNKEVNLFENNHWFSKVVYFSQNSFIFDDSLKENVILNSEFDQKKYNDIISIFQLTDLAARKTLGEFSKNISGGQKQRVALARALYSDKSIIILDEPTNMLDKINKKKFIHYLIKTKNYKTYIVVTHDQEIINSADKIIDIT
jgi:ABC-type bacteriocin/lantibiotic exporter with double-glycine peptidase domain